MKKISRFGNLKDFDDSMINITLGSLAQYSWFIAAYTDFFIGLYLKSIKINAKFDF